jgi:hypothetical protein
VTIHRKFYLIPQYAIYFCEMEPPRLPSFFKARRPRSFDFKPRYYDEDKERHKKLAKESAAQNSLRSLDLKSKWASGKRGRLQSSSIYRLAAIMAGLFAVAWWLLFS